MLVHTKIQRLTFDHMSKSSLARLRSPQRERIQLLVKQKEKNKIHTRLMCFKTKKKSCFKLKQKGV